MILFDKPCSLSDQIIYFRNRIFPENTNNINNQPPNDKYDH